MDGNGTEMAQNPMNKTEESTQSAVQPKQYHRSSFHQKKHSYRKQVEELIESSKNKLLPWAKLSMEEQEKNGSDMFGDLGGCEGLPVLLMIASLDEDGDGDLGDEEFHSFEEKGQAIVEKTLYLSNTVALVTALLLSMLLPLLVPAATGDAAAASDDSLDFFGKKGCRILLILYYLSLSLVTTTSLSGLMAAIMVITTLGNWLTEVKEKLEWIMEYVKCLMVQSLTMQLSFFFLALTVLFGALLTSPLLGCMSSVVFLVTVLFGFTLVFPNADRSRMKIHKQARENLSAHIQREESSA